MNFLKKLAPFLSTALTVVGGPAGAMAGKLITGALNISPSSKAEDIATALAGATPEQIEAIKKSEQDFQLQMKQLEISSVDELEKLVDDDRANARNREIQVRDWTPQVGFYLITMGFFGTLLFVILHDVPSASRDLVNIMIGSLGTAWISCVAYFFGSSSGSAEKTKVLGDIAKAA